MSRLRADPCGQAGAQDSFTVCSVRWRSFRLCPDFGQGFDSVALSLKCAVSMVRKRQVDVAVARQILPHAGVHAGVGEIRDECVA